MNTFAAAGPSAYWYLTRGTGIAALVLLTVSVVLGILGSLRFALAPRWPRFAIDTLHRDVSLLVIVVLLLHIATSVLDSFAPIKLTDAVIPFVSKYRPLWVGFGALSFDLLLALVITSLVRRRLGYRTWRAVHWLAYASWPVAVLHGLGTGSDTKLGWVLAITLVCVLAVMSAMLVRLARAWPEYAVRRRSAIALTIAAPLAIAIFTLQGPVQRGWARRAGTPVSLLAKTYRPAAADVTTGAETPTAERALSAPFAARLAGSVKQTPESGGAIVDLSLRLTGGARGRLRVRLAGAPLGGGGLSLTGSQVDLLADGLPSVMEGRILSLQGDQFLARVTDGSGSVLELRASLNVDSQTGNVTGVLSAAPGSGNP
jgi:DMSO/TMAO reductase YedYZ heme-binding membrane subunit